LRRRSSDEAKS
jgi:hypothetical protein